MKKYKKHFKTKKAQVFWGSFGIGIAIIIPYLGVIITRDLNIQLNLSTGIVFDLYILILYIVAIYFYWKYFLKKHKKTDRTKIKDIKSIILNQKTKDTPLIEINEEILKIEGSSIPLDYSFLENIFKKIQEKIVTKEIKKFKIYLVNYNVATVKFIFKILSSFNNKQKLEVEWKYFKKDKVSLEEGKNFQYLCQKNDLNNIRFKFVKVQ